MKYNIYFIVWGKWRLPIGTFQKPIYSHTIWFNNLINIKEQKKQQHTFVAIAWASISLSNSVWKSTKIIIWSLLFDYIRLQTWILGGIKVATKKWRIFFLSLRWECEHLAKMKRKMENTISCLASTAYFCEPLHFHLVSYATFMFGKLGHCNSECVNDAKRHRKMTVFLFYQTSWQYQRTNIRTFCNYQFLCCQKECCRIMGWIDEIEIT